MCVYSIRKYPPTPTHAAHTPPTGQRLRKSTPVQASQSGLVRHGVVAVQLRDVKVSPLPTRVPVVGQPLPWASRCARLVCRRGTEQQACAKVLSDHEEDAHWPHQKHDPQFAGSDKITLVETSTTHATTTPSPWSVTIVTATSPETSLPRSCLAVPCFAESRAFLARLAWSCCACLGIVG